MQKWVDLHQKILKLFNKFAVRVLSSLKHSVLPRVLNLIKHYCSFIKHYLKYLLSPILTVDCKSHLVLQVGTYSNGSQCIPCDLGHYCPSPANAPQPCPAGSYSNETGAVTCKACDAGYSCLIPSNTPVPCDAGEYSISGQATCTVSTKQFNCLTSKCSKMS